MALDTYSGLKTAVANFLNRQDSAVTDSVTDFIELAEAQMARRFVSRMKDGASFPRRLVQTETVAVALGDEFLAIPNDFQGPLEFIFPASPQQIDLDYLDDANFQRIKARRLPDAPYLNPVPTIPQYYTVVGDQFQLYPVADAAYSAELIYIARIAALSDAAPANWILTDYPDAYLYGALTASAPYLKDDNRATIWGTLFQTAVEDICNADPMPTSKVRLRTDVPRMNSYGCAPYTLNSTT